VGSRTPCTWESARNLPGGRQSAEADRERQVNVPFHAHSLSISAGTPISHFSESARRIPPVGLARRPPLLLLGFVLLGLAYDTRSQRIHLRSKKKPVKKQTPERPVNPSQLHEPISHGQGGHEEQPEESQS
jgi:hypothetical protein